MMNWPRLLSTRRFGHGDTPRPAPDRSAFQKDWDRVVFSSAFRRLQDKTQVHSLPENDYVRTRLTHSLEVSSVGRSLGAAIGQVIGERGDDLGEASPADIGAVVAAAAMAHDIGNPPFGHFGEDTIRHFFRDPAQGARYLDGLGDTERADLTGFDGNAEGFRLVARLQNWRGDGGLRLTAATLAATAKYPFGAAAGRTKFGFFAAERDLFRAVAEEVGLPPAGDGWARHPLAHLVEAADDICYRVVDLEDGFKLGRLGFDETEALLLRLLPGRPPRYGDVGDAPQKIAYLRAKAIGRLIDDAVTAFLDHEAAIMEGSFAGDLLNHTRHAETIAAIERVETQRLFRSRERLELEIGAGEVLTALIASFTGAVEDWAEAGFSDAGLSPRARALIGLLPVPPREASRYHRLLAVADFIAGMTDTYAVSTFRRLKGLVKA
jgi:dGTPase